MTELSMVAHGRMGCPRYNFSDHPLLRYDSFDSRAVTLHHLILTFHLYLIESIILHYRDVLHLILA